MSRAHSAAIGYHWGMSETRKDGPHDSHNSHLLPNNAKRKPESPRTRTVSLIHTTAGSKGRVDLNGE